MLLSHLHADHCLDLCGYYVMRKYHPDRPAAADPGLRARTAPPTGWPAPTTCRRDPGMTEEFDFRTYGGPVEIGPFAVDADPGRPPGRRRSASG